MNQRCYGIILWVFSNPVKVIHVERTGTGWGQARQEWTDVLDRVGRELRMEGL